MPSRRFDAVANPGQERPRAFRRAVGEQIGAERVEGRGGRPPHRVQRQQIGIGLAEVELAVAFTQHHLRGRRKTHGEMVLMPRAAGAGAACSRGRNTMSTRLTETTGCSPRRAGLVAPAARRLQQLRIVGGVDRLDDPGRRSPCHARRSSLRWRRGTRTGTAIRTRTGSRAAASCWMTTGGVIGVSRSVLESGSGPASGGGVRLAGEGRASRAGARAERGGRRRRGRRGATQIQESRRQRPQIAERRVGGLDRVEQSDRANEAGRSRLELAPIVRSFRVGVRRACHLRQHSRARPRHRPHARAGASCSSG